MKNLQIPDDEYAELVALCKQAGFRFVRGPKSQLRWFVMAAARAAVGAGLSQPQEPEQKETQK